MKNMLKKEEEPYKALTAYHSTPLESGYSPAKLLMDRIIRPTVPTPPGQRIPKWSHLDKFREADNLKARQKRKFDTRHRLKDIPEIHMEDKVWVPDTKKALVRAIAHTPRSYIDETPTGELWRDT